MRTDLSDADYRRLSDFRLALRRFTAFSEAQAQVARLTPQQHQALLAIRAAPPGEATIGYVAERLLLKPHSASELVDRMAASGLLERQRSAGDRRRTALDLTDHARTLLASLSAAHRDEIRRMKPLLAALLAEIG